MVFAGAASLNFCQDFLAEAVLPSPFYSELKGVAMYVVTQLAHRAGLRYTRTSGGYASTAQRSAQLLFLAWIGFALAFGVCIAHGQSSPANLTGGFRTSEHSPSMLPMPITPSVFPLFIEDETISSQITLVNSSGLQTYANLVIRNAAGQSWNSQRIDFAPHAQVQVVVGDLLSKMGLHLTSGSIVVNQSPSLRRPSIVGQLTLSNVASSPESYVEEEMGMPGIFDSQVLRSVSEATEESPEVAITSLSSEIQHVNIECDRNGASIVSQATLSAAGQIIVRPCGSQSATAVTGIGAHSYPAAISVTTDGPNDELAVFGITHHRDESSGSEYIGALQFFDPQSFESSSLVFTGVSSGTSLTPSGAGPYSSQIAIANFSQTASHIAVTVYRTSASQQVAASTTNAVLQPGSVEQLPLGSLTTDTGDAASVVVTYDSAPGSIYSKIISVGGAAPHQLEELVKDALDGRNGGSHPWSVEGDSTSDLILFNHGETSQPFSVAIEAPGGVEWTNNYTLAAHQTFALSIGDLIANKLADDRGRQLPASAKSGSVIWHSPGVGIGSGRMLIRSTANFAAHSYSCGQAYVICGGEPITLSPLTVGSQEQAWAYADYCVDYSGGLECMGDFAYSNIPSTNITWTSSDSNVAQIGTAGASANIYGNSSGTAAINATMVDSFGCAGVATGGIVVAPQITGISPSSVYIGSNNFQITISGSGFGTAPSVSLPSGVTVASQSATDTQITLTVNAAYSATIGNGDVSVTANGVASNTETLLVDGPAYMTVNLDTYGLCSGCTTTIRRRVSYQIYNYSGTTTNLGNQVISESVSVGTNSCSPAGSANFATCAEGFTTSSSGTFTDAWSLNSDNLSPSGCGVPINYDHWQMCFNGNPKAFGTLSGYIHTNSTNINGYVVPPNAGEMLTGTRINP